MNPAIPVFPKRNGTTNRRLPRTRTVPTISKGRVPQLRRAGRAGGVAQFCCGRDAGFPGAAW
ncbi:hypothetical protein NtRootD5_22050 [Arthrobacter sp. NtRootD5]|nr:hypothetical protein NtRootD5_22050 [Arthrobacter sp. NtRootD5]